MTADKQMPSALDYLGHFKEALEIERRLARPGVSKAVKDLLNTLVATYNKMTTSKRHRVDANRKAVTYNMFLPLLYIFSLKLSGYWLFHIFVMMEKIL